MQLITDFFVPKEKTLLNMLPTDLKNIIGEYTQSRYKKPMHGKIMKDFLALFHKQLNTMCYWDDTAPERVNIKGNGTLSGLYIGKPKYKSSCTNFKFRGRGIGFYESAARVFVAAQCVWGAHRR